MNSQLYFSNSAGYLLDRLADEIARGDPFLAPRIATPTPALRRMVQMGLAERLGAAANLAFPLLEQSLWDCLAGLDAHRLMPGREPARLLDTRAMQTLILAQLLGRPPHGTSHYLDHLPGKASAASWRKALQLSQRLAMLFREYEYSRVREHGREGLASLWLLGLPCFADYLDAGVPEKIKRRVGDLERWQGELYRQVFGSGGLRDRLGEATGRYLYTLPQYSQLVFAQNRQDSERVSPSSANTLYLFGLAHISPFHRSLIQLLSDAGATADRPMAFGVFALNPCAEYWEDSLDPRTRRRRLQQDLLRQEKFHAWRRLEPGEKERLRLRREALWAEALAPDPGDNALLARWGMVGRENVQLWCQVTDYDFAGRFREPGGETLLACLQRAVLHRLGPLPPEERRAQDASMRLYAAPEIHREIETLLHDLLERFRLDPTLRPDDVAILLPDKNTYGPVIDAVFGARGPEDAGFVPYVRPEAGLRLSDPYLRGLLTLAAMAQGSWDRPHLLALLENARCQAKLGFSKSMAEALVEAVADLNLYRGGGEEGCSGGLDSGGFPRPHHFLTGMRRLLLGLWMESPRDLDDTSYQGYQPHAAAGLDRQAVGAFAGLLATLETSLAPFLGDERKTLSDWAGTFFSLASALLQPDAGLAAEAALDRDLHRWRLELAARDRALAAARQDAAESSAPLWPGEFFLESLRETLSAAEVAGPPWLSGGVQVGGLEALRGLPFRVICVPGLQEGDFPDEPMQNSLDLRQFRRVIGDLEPASRNRFTLLMAMMQAGDAVILSYVDRDLERDRDRQRSSALGEWIDYLESDILPAAPENPKSRGCFRTLSVTLDPLEASPPSPFPEDHRLARVLRQARDAKANAAESPAPDGTQPWPAAYSSSSSSFISAPAHPEAPTGKPAEIADIADVARFIRHPRRQALQKALGLSHRFTDDPDSEEAYTVPGNWMKVLPWDCLAEAARTGPGFSLMASLERRLRGLGLRGDLPPGSFGDQARQDMAASIAAWWDQLEKILRPSWGEGRWDSLLSARFGSAWPKIPLLPRLDLPGIRHGDFILQGYQGFIWPKQGGGLGLLCPAQAKKSWGPLLQPFVFACAGLLSQPPLSRWLSEGPLEVWVLPQAGKQEKPRGYAIDLRHENAGAWLDGILPWMSRQGLVPGHGLGPPLDAWEGLLPPGQTAFPWNGDEEASERFRRQVRRKLAQDQAQPEPGRSPLEEAMALLPPQDSADPLAWVRDVLGMFMHSTRTLKVTDA